jgi:hypothetical protein
MADRYRIRTNGAIGGRRGFLIGFLVSAREANPAQSVAYGSDTPRSGASALRANGIGSTAGGAELYEFCYSWLRGLCSRGRVAIVGGRRFGADQRGFRGSLQLPAKSLRRGALANVAYADSVMDLTAFRHAYVSGQVLLITSFHGRFPLGA